MAKTSDLAYRTLADDSYKSDDKRAKSVDVRNEAGEIIDSWKPIESFHDKETGMDSVVYGRDTNGDGKPDDITVAFRGTEGGI
ncbi:hypothetical protein [Bacillus sp. XF8]|uniref:hypothetical protein n=1 Tax=Bacillus sp. XF8 TaxID=2819289 RepID=UPI001AA056B5|nr:hypothetical protein [Bacillus sp. XF8]MBO1582328.1 hypothetical protein [Bacillus sp. XF8]